MRISYDETLEVMRRYQQGEKLKVLADELHISQSRLGQIRDQLGRRALNRMFLLTLMCLRCNVSLNEIMREVERAVLSFDGYEGGQLMEKYKNVDFVEDDEE